MDIFFFNKDMSSANCVRSMMLQKQACADLGLCLGKRELISEKVIYKTKSSWRTKQAEATIVF